MPEVQKFAPQMIEHYLNLRRIPYHTNEKHDECWVPIDEHRTIFFQSKDADTVYCIWAISRNVLPKDQWSQAIEACNAWNASHLWPKAYSFAGQIGLVQDLPVEPGVHQEFINHYTDVMIRQILDCWDWLSQQHGIVS